MTLLFNIPDQLLSKTRNQLLEKPEIINPEVAYQQAISLAHEEDVAAWGSIIQQWFSQGKLSEISLLQLQQVVSMPLVQVWLALLLNDFAIEQRGEFYETEQIWVAPR